MGGKKIGFRGWLAALLPPTETAVVTTNSASGWGGGGKKRVRSWRRQLGLVLAVVFEVGYVTYLSPLTIYNKIKELTFLFCMRCTHFFFHGIFSHGASFDKFTSLLNEFGFK